MKLVTFLDIDESEKDAGSVLFSHLASSLLQRKAVLMAAFNGEGELSFFSCHSPMGVAAG